MSRFGCIGVVNFFLFCWTFNLSLPKAVFDAYVVVFDSDVLRLEYLRGRFECEPLLFNMCGRMYSITPHTLLLASWPPFLSVKVSSWRPACCTAYESHAWAYLLCQHVPGSIEYDDSDGRVCPIHCKVSALMCTHRRRFALFE